MAPPGSSALREAHGRGLPTVAVSMRNGLDLVSVFVLARAFHSFGVDLVHLHTGRATWLGALAARLARRRAITTRRMDKEIRRGWRTRVVYGRLVDRAVAISSAVEARLLAGGVRRSRVCRIPSAVDPALLVPRRSRPEVRAELGIGADEFVVLTLAALVPRKGIDVLLEACALLGRDGSSPRLLVGGDGPERGRLEARAAVLGLTPRVGFLGHRTDKAELLGACDVFTLPSRLEGLGVAALEAMAAGRAVVASRVGGLAEAVIDGETGLLVPAEDPARLALALARLRDDADLRARLAAGGPRRVANGHLPDQMVDAYVALYREVLAQREVAS